VPLWWDPCLAEIKHVGKDAASLAEQAALLPDGLALLEFFVRDVI
jgi:hypothetical protein